MKKILILVLLPLLIACTGTESATTDPEMHEWYIGDWIDDYGQPNGSHYIYLVGEGTLTNYAATREEAICIFMVSDKSVYLKFFNYGSHLNKDGKFYNVKFKTDNEEHEYVMFNSTAGECSPDSLDVPKILNLIKKGGTMLVSATSEREYTTDVQYTFSFNTDGYEYASQFITK